MLFMDMENSWKVGAVKGCPGKFCAKTCEAVQMGPRVRLAEKEASGKLQDYLLGGGVGGSCDTAGWLAGKGAEGALLE